MAKSTDESRSRVNQAVRKKLEVGESVHATSLRELARALGLDPNARVVGTLKSMKFNRAYRNSAAFDLRFGYKESGVPRQDFILTRRPEQVGA